MCAPFVAAVVTFPGIGAGPGAQLGLFAPVGALTWLLIAEASRRAALRAQEYLRAYYQHLTQPPSISAPTSLPAPSSLSAPPSLPSPPTLPSPPATQSSSRSLTAVGGFSARREFWVGPFLAALLFWASAPAAPSGVNLSAHLFATLPFLAFTPVWWPLVRLDFLIHRLPNALVGRAAVYIGGALVGASAGRAWLEGQDWWAALADFAHAGGRALCCAGLVGLLLALGTRFSLGRGDVKLGLVLALVLGWYGWRWPWWGLVVAILGAGLWALVLLLLRRGGLRSHIAMGPWLIIGSTIAWLAALS